MKAALRWMAGILPLMILALILAVLAWVVAAEKADPTRTEPYPQKIQITPSGLPEGMVVVGEFDETVQVTVRAPESVWRSIGTDDFSAAIDLTGLVEAGAYSVPVVVELREQPSSLTWEPETLTLELATWAEQSVPVQMQVEGEPALGYLTQEPTATPHRVMISGPSSYVTQVVNAATQVSVQDASTDVEGEFRLQPLDSAGQSVPYVNVTPAMIQVHVPIELSEEYRTLTIRPVQTGQVAAGYRITDFSVDPPTVNVRGAPVTIAALPGFIETESIAVEGAQADVVVHPALDVPQNIVVVSGQPITVTFFIEAIQSSLIVEITPTLQGLEPGLAATILPETVEVFLNGPLPLLDALEIGDMRVVLDLFDLEPGTYQIEPQVVVPENVIARSILPATVQVEIYIPPTPTPTPTPPSSPVPTPTEVQD